MSWGQFVSKATPVFRTAGTKLGEFLASQGVKETGKKIARDAAIMVAAEQGIPRLLGAEAPHLGESVIRQTVGSAVSHGVEGGLNTAFGGPGEYRGVPNRKGTIDFKYHGLDPNLSKRVGQFTGQVIGQKTAHGLLPGRQDYPFLPQTLLEHSIGQASPLLAGSGHGSSFATERRNAHGSTFSAERPGHPVSPTGAIPASSEPESAQVVRRDSQDLIFQKQLDAQLDREHYLNRIALANAQNAPRTITQRVEQDPQKSAMAALHEGYKVQRYG